MQPILLTFNYPTSMKDPENPSHDIQRQCHPSEQEPSLSRHVESK